MSKMYSCPNCKHNYVSTDTNPEPLCKWCTNESPQGLRIKELEAKVTELEREIIQLSEEKQRYEP